MYTGNCTFLSLINCYQPFEAPLNITLPRTPQQLQDLVKTDGNVALYNLITENSKFCS